MSSLTARAAGWQKSSGCMLTFHRAAPAAQWADLPNKGFYLNLDYLDNLLGTLKRDGWEIATVDEIVCRLKLGENGSRLVNFSVDDCYRDTFEHVVPLFRRHRVPVTLFVTTGIPDGTMPLGWAGLEAILAERPQITYNGETVDVSTRQAKQQWFARISSAWEAHDFYNEFAEFCRANGADQQELRDEHAITWEMLESFKGDQLVEIGAHTVSHYRMSDLSADQALQEIAGSRQRLRERLGADCRHFAFPYGRSGDCGQRDFDLAREAGFSSASTTRKGLVSQAQDVYCLPRNTLNGAYQSMAYANFLLSGLAGFAARVLGRV
jgi:peptidoglycan/xylan/chitin deacetylase (PgdA/CDA1 family)